MKKIMKEVYITTDNKEFTDENLAKRHETKISRKKYYKVCYAPDLNETGIMTKTLYLSVEPASNMAHSLMVEDYLYHRFGSSVAYVQGVARTANWSYSKINLEDLSNNEKVLEITENDLRHIKGE